MKKSLKTLVIAEVGVNHNGKLNLAKKLIDEAKINGADIIKFQIFNTDSLVIKSASKAHYQKNKKNKNESQYHMLKKLELSKKNIKKIYNYCNYKDIEFLGSVFDIQSFNFLKSLKPKRIKIPSGEITNLLLLELIGKLNKKIILSTGMSKLDEIKRAIKVLTNSGTNKKNITILHCTSSYPTKYEDVNLKAMLEIKKKLNTSIGYSDHTIGSEISIAAVTLGAKIIEKHFTLNKKFEGPDHSSSMNPKEFKKMVESIRIIEKSMGLSTKKATKIELKNSLFVRKSIFANRKISKGEKFTSKNITIKRPGIGKSPMMWYKIIGTETKKNYKKDDPI